MQRGLDKRPCFLFSDAHDTGPSSYGTTRITWPPSRSRRCLEASSSPRAPPTSLPPGPSWITSCTTRRRRTSWSGWRTSGRPMNTFSPRWTTTRTRACLAPTRVSVLQISARRLDICSGSFENLSLCFRSCYLCGHCCWRAQNAIRTKAMHLQIGHYSDVFLFHLQVIQI